MSVLKEIEILYTLKESVSKSMPNRHSRKGYLRFDNGGNTRMYLTPSNSKIIRGLDSYSFSTFAIVDNVCDEFRKKKGEGGLPTEKDLFYSFMHKGYTLTDC